jgi:leucyl/phenylalanyl-tRNA---protein transferase
VGNGSPDHPWAAPAPVLPFDAPVVSRPVREPGGRPSGIAATTSRSPHPAEAFFGRLDVAGAPRELVALGGRLDVETLVAAYRAGCFPWPATGPHQQALEQDAVDLARSGEVPVLWGSASPEPPIPWTSPDPRAVLFPDAVVVSRSLRQRLRRCGWETTMDIAFDDVVAACADREGTWITPAMQQGYGRLHEAGVAHSLEVWAGARLVGGLYGVLTGRVFSGESMFYCDPDASKAAVVDLCQRLVEVGVVVIETEQESEHLERLGQVLVAREDYVALVRRLRDQVVKLPRDRRPVGRLVRRGPQEIS